MRNTKWRTIRDALSGPVAIPEIETMLEKHEVNQLLLSPRCHQEAGLDAFYKSGTGILVLSCRQCHREVASVYVALVSKLKL